MNQNTNKETKTDAFEHLMAESYREHVRFLKDEYYHGSPEADDDEFIDREAKEMSEDLAWDAYYAGCIDDDCEEE